MKRSKSVDCLDVSDITFNIGISAFKVSQKLKILSYQFTIKALEKIEENLDRMLSLTIKCQSGRLTDADRALNQSELNILSEECVRIIQNTTFNGEQVIDLDFAAVTQLDISTIAPARDSLSKISDLIVNTDEFKFYNQLHLKSIYEEISYFDHHKQVFEMTIKMKDVSLLDDFESMSDLTNYIINRLSKLGDLLANSADTEDITTYQEEKYWLESQFDKYIASTEFNGKYLVDGSFGAEIDATSQPDGALGLVDEILQRINSLAATETGCTPVSGAIPSELE